MRIEELWQALEADALAGTPGAGGWLLRLARPSSQCPLFAGLELASRRRAILLRLPRAALPSRRKWPRCKGLEPLAVMIDNGDHFGVAVRDPRFADVFTALVEDLTRRVCDVGTPAARAQTFLGQLARWQKFLSASQEGLNKEQQRGLYGELHTLRKHLLPALGAAVAVGGWRSTQTAHQDFQFAPGAVEVKTTTAKQPQAVRITSERQLDDTGIPALYLHIVVLDEREVEGAVSPPGDSLPRIVADLRQQLAANAPVADMFDDRLLDAGYRDMDAFRYEGRRYALRREHTFHVRPGFPRLVENDLPDGVGEASYALSIAACEAFGFSITTAMETLAKAMSKPKSKGTKK